MSRPKFLNCIMPVEVIRRIRENQEYYDKDPEGYDRRERQREEERRQEAEAEREWYDQ